MRLVRMRMPPRPASGGRLMVDHKCPDCGKFASRLSPVYPSSAFSAMGGPDRCVCDKCFEAVG